MTTRGWRAALLALLAAGLLPWAAAGTELPAAVDLRREAAQAAGKGGPLIVLFSRPDCKYCETVRRDYLEALASHPRYRDRVVVRQINQDGKSPLTDFDGTATSHAGFASREKIRFVPVVVFYGPQGRQLAPPIVGARLPDFYPSYLNDAIEQSIGALNSR